MTSSVVLREASFQSLEENAAIAILGKRRSGKTTWAKFLLQSINLNVDRFVALCGNKDNQSEWTNIIQPLFVMSKNVDYLKRLRDYQDIRVSRYTSQNKKIPRKYRICIIFDDCGSDRTFMHSKIMKDILSNGRHYGMTIILLCQYLNQMHCENRDQLDYVGVLYTANLKNIKKIHEEYVNVCDLRTFRFVLNACTVNKGCCWIDNTKNAGKVDECVFFKHIPKKTIFYTIGGQNIRDYGKKHCMTESDEKNKNHNEFRDMKGSFVVRKV